jgi:hypothetical protein
MNKKVHTSNITKLITATQIKFCTILKMYRIWPPKRHLLNTRILSRGYGRELRLGGKASNVLMRPWVAETKQCFHKKKINRISQLVLNSWPWTILTHYLNFSLYGILMTATRGAMPKHTRLLFIHSFRNSTINTYNIGYLYVCIRNTHKLQQICNTYHFLRQQTLLQCTQYLDPRTCIHGPNLYSQSIHDLYLCCIPSVARFMDYRLTDYLWPQCMSDADIHPWLCPLI